MVVACNLAQGFMLPQPVGEYGYMDEKHYPPPILQAYAPLAHISSSQVTHGW